MKRWIRLATTTTKGTAKKDEVGQKQKNAQNRVVRCRGDGHDPASARWVPASEVPATPHQLESTPLATSTRLAIVSLYDTSFDHTVDVHVLPQTWRVRVKVNKEMVALCAVPQASSLIFFFLSQNMVAGGG